MKLSDIEDTVDRVRRVLKSNSSTCVKLECFNREEVDLIKSRLTEGENRRVCFSWMFN